MEIIAEIAKCGASNHLEIGIMNSGKLSVSVSIWNRGGRYNQTVTLNKAQVIELLNAIDEWVDYTDTVEKCAPIFQAAARDYSRVLDKIAKEVLTENPI